MTRFKAVLVDLSGTLHVGNEVIPGAVQAIKRLREAGIQLRFATNTTKESRSCLWLRLNKLGFDISEAEMFTSLTAARDLVVQNNLRPFLMVDEAALPDFQGLLNVPLTEANAVVVGLAPERFDHSTMCDAMNLLLNGAKLIAIHRGRYYKTSDGLSLGPGPFVTALEYATGVTAQVVGKPSASFFEQAMSSFSCPPAQVAMIGDDVIDDVLGAQSAGLSGFLVRTGKYRSGDELKCSSEKGNFVCDSIVEAVDAILEDSR